MEQSELEIVILRYGDNEGGTWELVQQVLAFVVFDYKPMSNPILGLLAHKPNTKCVM